MKEKEKQWIIAVKVKITMKVQNSIETLCFVCLLYHCSLGKQTSCADLLLMIIKPSTTKWAYTDSGTLTYSITRHTRE